TTRVLRHSIHCHPAQPSASSHRAQTQESMPLCASLTDRSSQRAITVAARRIRAGLTRTIPWWRISEAGDSPGRRYRGMPRRSTRSGTGSRRDQGVEDPPDVAHAVGDDLPGRPDDVGGLAGGGEDRVEQEDREQPEDDLLDRWRV